MDVLVLGATGSLGRSLTAELTRRGHSVRATSREARPAHDGLRWLRVDVATGEGLIEAVTGAEAVVDAANSRSLRRAALDAVLVRGTGRVLQACHAAGDVPYVGISIVGIESVPHPYYRAKRRQEQVIEGAAGPWSLLRATQFHDLVDQLMTVAARPPVILLPTSVRLQPVDAADVAVRLADAAEAGPGGRLPQVAGPRVQCLGELARVWLQARGRSKRLVGVRLPGRAGRALADGVLCAPQDAGSGRDFASWLATTG